MSFKCRAAGAWTPVQLNWPEQSEMRCCAPGHSAFPSWRLPLPELQQTDTPAHKIHVTVQEMKQVCIFFSLQLDLKCNLFVYSWVIVSWLSYKRHIISYVSFPLQELCFDRHFQPRLTKATPLPLSPVWMSIQASGPSSTRPQWCSRDRRKDASSCLAFDPRANNSAPSWTKHGRFGIIRMTTAFSGRYLWFQKRKEEREYSIVLYHQPT